MPAEQLDLFGGTSTPTAELPRAPIVQRPAEPVAPIAAAETSIEAETDWHALRDAARGEFVLAALDGLRDRDGKIKEGHRMIETRRLSNPPVPPAWTDKYNGLIADRGQAVKSMISNAAIPYLNGQIALRLETARFMRRNPAVCKAANGIEPLDDHRMIDAAISDVFNALMPAHLYVQAGTDAHRPNVKADDFERALNTWQTPESAESHARLIAALEATDDQAGMIAAANDYLKIALRLAWAKLPV